MVVCEYLDGKLATAPVECDQPLRQPILRALDACWGRRRWPFRAVLLRAHDEADAVRKAQVYIQRVDEHVYGLDPRAVPERVGSRSWTLSD